MKSDVLLCVLPSGEGCVQEVWEEKLKEGREVGA